ncbi:MAG: Hsp20/alpha crystallin family protein [Bacilli bacterium]|nr:Hsp20/alpha crystallin family protein [Bacilli bacterium]
MRYLVRRNNDFLDSIFDGLSSRPLSRCGNLMKTDIKKIDDSYQIDIELPGFNKEDIKIDLEDGYLTIFAKREQDNSEEGKTIVRTERYYGEYSRSYYVGNLALDEVTAKYNNGILTVLVPTEGKAESKKYITIE